MFGQRRGRWANIETALGEFPVFAGNSLLVIWHIMLTDNSSNPAMSISTDEETIKTLSFFTDINEITYKTALCFFKHKPLKPS